MRHAGWKMRKTEASRGKELVLDKARAKPVLGPAPRTEACSRVWSWVSPTQRDHSLGWDLSHTARPQLSILIWTKGQSLAHGQHTAQGHVILGT